MRPTHRCLWFILLVSVTLLAQAKNNAISIKDLVAPTAIANPDLSPSGRYLGNIHEDDDGIRHLIITDFETGEISPLRGHEDFDFNRFWWFGDERIVAEAIFHEKGTKVLYAADRKDLASSRPLVGGSITVLGVPSKRPDRMLINKWWTNDSPSGLNSFAAQEVDITKTSESRHTRNLDSEFKPALLYPTQSDLRSVSYWVDTAGELAAVHGRDDHEFQIWRYLPTTSTWEQTSLDPEKHHVHRILAGNRGWWISQVEADGTSTLRLYHPTEDRWEEPQHVERDFDLRYAQLHMRADEQTLAGISYYRKRLHYVWFSDDYAKAHQALQKQQPNWDYRLVDRDDAEQRFLFHGLSGSHAGAYLLVDLTNESLQTIGEVLPAWRSHRPSAARYISFKASDGSRLDGILTLPAGASKTNPVPLIVKISDEPYVWSHRRTTQYFASKGYAVFEPNHQASTSYIVADRSAKELDLKLIATDLNKAVKGALGTGIINREKVVIYGRGAGGLFGAICAAKEPDLYAGLISRNAVYDFKSMLQHRRAYYGTEQRDYVRAKLSEVSEEDGFRDISPAKMMENFDTPVLLIGSKFKSSPSYKQLQKFARALRSRDVPVTTFTAEMLSAGRLKPQDEVKYWKTVDTFLAEHTGE
jgi:dipeptidyl aminopeptidase/acylaminoacyl peptidase